MSSVTVLVKAAHASLVILNAPALLFLSQNRDRCGHTAAFVKTDYGANFGREAIPEFDSNRAPNHFGILILCYVQLKLIFKLRKFFDEGFISLHDQCVIGH